MARLKRLWSARAGGPATGPGLGDAQTLLWCREVVAQVNALSAEMESRTDGQLRELTGWFRARLAGGESLDGLLPEAFAAVREAAARTLRQRHFDVQVMGGAVLHRGQIAEMRTGEGKTLTATLPAYLNALPGAGVHVLTANDYLARRDAEWMGPVYRLLGLRTGLIQGGTEPAARRVEYGADVTYGSWEEFGYDYLRDNLAWEPQEQVRRGQPVALVDEADLILVDEMRTPLTIAGPSASAESRHAEFAAIAAVLERGLHYQADERARTVALTADGTRRVQESLGVSELSAAVQPVLIYYLYSALKAKEFFRRDRDYIVSDGQAVIIDQISGRPHHSRRYSDGVHEAIEAREGLTIRAPTQPLATAWVWDYLGQYQRLAGMTGSAATEADVYRQVYGLDVVTIPTSKPMIRLDHPDEIYRTRRAKLAALADEAAARHAAGQPVLVGTASIEELEEVSALLTSRGVDCEVLTARNPEREGQIIAAAARLGAVTVIAGMAGRGVDIILGGADGGQHDEVADRGGLCVLGAERYLSPRLELHLRGRAGRQGDPGEAKFFLSYDDDIVTSAFGPKAASFLGRISSEADRSAKLSAGIDRAQAQSGAGQRAWFAQALSYDGVLADQQHVFYAERAAALGHQDLRDRIQAMIGEVIRAQVGAATGQHLAVDRLWRALRELYPVSVTPEALAAQRGCEMTRLPPDFVSGQIAADARSAYDRRESELSPPIMRDLERRVTLSVSDRAWGGHLAQMPELLHKIATRSAGGVAPLPEYRREAAELFTAMGSAIKLDIVGTLFNIELEVS